MPNFDTSTIEGFDTMTAEEQVAALLKVEIPEAVDMSKFVSKEIFDKKASETATLSKQLKELKEKAPNGEVQQLKDKIAELEKSNTIKDYTARYIKQGYDAELAEETAKAFAEGDMETVFKNGEKRDQAMAEKIKEDLLNKTPQPGGSGGGKQEESDGMKQAKRLGQAKAEANITTADVLKHYI